MVSYDDPNSFGESSFTRHKISHAHVLPTAAKGRFVREKGLLGFAMWEAAGDYQDLLLDSIETGVGVTQSC